MDLWGPERYDRRRILALLEGLPADCALWRAIHGTGPFRYGYAEQLTRLLLTSSEAKRAALWARLKDKYKPLEPEPPWLVAEKVRTDMPTEVDDEAARALAMFAAAMG